MSPAQSALKSNATCAIRGISSKNKSPENKVSEIILLTSK